MQLSKNGIFGMAKTFETDPKGRTRGVVAPREKSEDGPLKARNSHVLPREKNYHGFFQAFQSTTVVVF
jgi:hypothetical protein